MQGQRLRMYGPTELDAVKYILTCHITKITATIYDAFPLDLMSFLFKKWS